MAFVVPGFLALVGVLLIGLRGWLWLRAPRRHLCPGPRLNWRHWIAPVWLVFRPRCGYDLSGHLARHRLEMGSAIVCPECGRDIQRRRQMIRTPRVWRPAHLGSIFILAGLLVYRYPPLSAMTVVQYTPTNILLRGEGMLGVGTPLEVRGEIRRRALDHQLDDTQTCRFVRLLVNDLRNDSLASNAKAALSQLKIFGLFCITPLLEAVESTDLQQRRFAVRILQESPMDGEAPLPLLRASAIDLRSDHRDYNAGRSFLFLIRHACEAEEVLAMGMQSDDAQQRLLCATIAGIAGREALIEPATAVLVSHLANNSIEGDAIVAARGLWGFGQDVLPLLEAHRHESDEQLRQSVEYIVQRMTTNESLVRLQLKLPLARLTRGSIDALVLQPEELNMPSFPNGR